MSCWSSVMTHSWPKHFTSTTNFSLIHGLFENALSFLFYPLCTHNNLLKLRLFAALLMRFQLILKDFSLPFLVQIGFSIILLHNFLLVLSIWSWIIQVLCFTLFGRFYVNLSSLIYYSFVFFFSSKTPQALLNHLKCIILWCCENPITMETWTTNSPTKLTTRRRRWMYHVSTPIAMWENLSKHITK